MHARFQNLFRRLEKSLFSQRKLRSQKRLQFRSRIAVENLEDRRLLAVLYVDNPGDYVITTDTAPSGLSNGDTVTWNPGAGSQHGGPVTNLTFGTNAFGTIQSAVTAAAAGDTIRVGPGTFAEGVNVNKQLIVLGNQVDVDAQSGRVGAAETIVTGTGNSGITPFQITADDVVINGFTIEGNTSANQFGFGVLIGAGTAGAEVRNNIIQNNIAGISLANDNGGNPAIISGNLIRNNNQPGPISGTGIYTDQFNAGGALTGALIDNNTFTNNSNVAVLIGPTVAASPASNITISQNIMTGNGNGILLFNTLNSTVTQNEVLNSLGSQVVLGGGVNGLTMTENCIENGAARGIRIGDFGGGSPNQNITINRNSIEANVLAGLEIVAGQYVGPLNAELNWWGSATGPTIASNPGGTGEEIIDPLNQVDFVPFVTSGEDTNTGVRGCQLAIADLSVTKADSPDPVTAGENLTYTIVVTNTGTGAATGVTLTDAIPANTTFVSFVAPAGWSNTTPAVGGTGSVTSTRSSLAAADGPQTFTLTVRVNSSTPSAATITNTATVSSTNADASAANNTDTETTTVITSADVSVTKADSPDPVAPGQNLTYTITVTNAGASDAQTVTLTDVIPVNTTFVSFTAPAGFSSTTPPVGGTGLVTTTTPTLAAGATATFTLVVNVNAATTVGSTITNTASVTSTTTDANAGNNTDTETTAVAITADLSVTKTDSPDPVAPGDNVTYTIVLSNAGNSAATNVVLTDAIPTNTTFVSATQTSGPTFTLTPPPAGGTGTFTATAASFAAGATATFTLIVNVDDTALDGTTISNTVTVASSTTDPNAANNTDTETTTVEEVGLPECEVFTANLPGNPRTATLGIDADDPTGNVVVVTGTSGRDIIIVEPRPGDSSRVRVVHNGRTIGTFNRSDVDHIVVFGRGGDDKIVINGSLAIRTTLFGDEGNDEIFGGRANDGIDGGGGNDRLFGGSGNDTICGGFGADQIFGQGGNDLLGGDAGNDRVFGEAGNDLLLGSVGNDQLFGGSGNDFLFGQAGSDQLFGDPGHDVVVGGDGNDRLFGDGGRDLLIGGLGADQLFGESDEDILVAGATVHDEDLEALQAIMAEWRSSNRYIVRVNNIRNGGGANGAFTLDDATVINDSSTDSLLGGSSLDWFLFGPGDRVRDRGRNEQAN